MNMLHLLSSICFSFFLFLSLSFRILFLACSTFSILCLNSAACSSSFSYFLAAAASKFAVLFDWGEEGVKDHFSERFTIIFLQFLVFVTKLLQLYFSLLLENIFLFLNSFHLRNSQFSFILFPFSQYLTPFLKKFLSTFILFLYVFNHFHLLNLIKKTIMCKFLV